MRLFHAKFEYEEAAVVVASDWPAAVELFRAAAQSWTTDKWCHEDWPREFSREVLTGIEVPEMEPFVLGTYFERDGWEMIYRGGQWERTGHDSWGAELREMLAANAARRVQLQAGADAEADGLARSA